MQAENKPETENPMRTVEVRDLNELNPLAVRQLVDSIAYRIARILWQRFVLTLLIASAVVVAVLVIRAL